MAGISEVAMFLITRCISHSVQEWKLKGWEKFPVNNLCTDPDQIRMGERVPTFKKCLIYYNLDKKAM